MDVLNAEVKVFPAHEFAASAARSIAEHLSRARSAIITGGGTARRIYEQLARFEAIPNLEILFSDERAVPPDHPDSNYGMASRTLLDPLGLTNVHRIRGEDDPAAAALAYETEISDLLVGQVDVALLGVGADAHLAALFPGDPAVDEIQRLCVAVDRPDGMRGITLTGPALTSARRVIVAAAGPDKAEAVGRAFGDDSPMKSPVRLLAGAPHLTFLLDEAAASLLNPR
ncbi:MAG TPA: 6-phosphogluconolactonase [Actinomycetota bacterium]|nr:6-phosphogluconolactonase [Actinomycetota bacterium]